MANRIDKDIETTADVYPPSTYQQLLTNFHDLALATDSAGRGPDGFIPLTQARSNRTGRSSIPFVIGVIPPSVEITGRLLDRSATVIQLEDGQSSGATSNSGDDAAGLNQGGPGPAGRNIGAHRAARQTCIDAFTKEMGREPTTAELQYLQAVAFLETTYGNGWKGEMVGSNNWGAVHCTPKQEKDDTFFGLLRGNTGVNIGGTRISAGRCISYTDTHSDGSKYSQTFRSYATPEDGARDVVKNIFKQRGVSKALESGSIYDASLEMRRGHYYSGWCPEATKKYGAKVARESEQTPDKNEGTLACEREALHVRAEHAPEQVLVFAVGGIDHQRARAARHPARQGQVDQLRGAPGGEDRPFGQAALAGDHAHQPLGVRRRRGPEQPRQVLAQGFHDCGCRVEPGVEHVGVHHLRAPAQVPELGAQGVEEGAAMGAGRGCGGIRGPAHRGAGYRAARACILRACILRACILHA